MVALASLGGLAWGTWRARSTDGPRAAEGPQVRCPPVTGGGTEETLLSQDELHETLQVERDEFERSWGTPVSPSSDPRLEQEPVETAIATLGYEWDAVDCSEFPCVALVLSEEPIERAALRAQLGLPYAHIGLSAYTGDRYLHVASIAFIDLC
jgi:hypothetical protein